MQVNLGPKYVHGHRKYMCVRVCDCGRLQSFVTAYCVCEDIVYLLSFSPMHRIVGTLSEEVSS